MTTATITNNNPRIYVACLASYNAGQLHGVWIDAAQDVDDIQDAIDEMLRQSPVPNAEEWAIHDVEDFESVPISEHESLEMISIIANGLMLHDEAYAIYCNIFDDYDVDNFEERYQGCHRDKESFVYDYMEDIGALKAVEDAGLQTCYIDFEAIARDWFITDFIGEDGDEGFHVYYNY